MCFRNKMYKHILFKYNFTKRVLEHTHNICFNIEKYHIIIYEQNNIYLNIQYDKNF